MDPTLDITEEELRVLILETSEHLETLESGFVRLEQNRYDTELLRAIFRAAHTLKSTAGMISPRISELTHVLETVLDGLSKGTLAVSLPLVDVCFDSLDALKQLHEEIVGGTTVNLDIAPLIQRLRVISATAGPVAATPSPTSTTPPTIPEGPVRAKHVAVIISAESMASAARALLVVQTMHSLGEVKDLNPTPDIIESAKPVRMITGTIYTSHPTEVVQRVLASFPEIDNVMIEEGETIAPAPSTSGMPAAARHELLDKTVRTSVERLDNLMNLVGELITDRNRLNQLRADFEGGRFDHVRVDNLAQTSLHLGRIVDQLQDEVMRIRLLPISNVFNKFPRLVRDLSRANGKNIQVVIHGGDTELDRSVIEVISDPLVHLLRNSVDHGIELPAERLAAQKAEQGTILISARHEENHILISIEDDGRGIDEEKVKASAVARGVLTSEEAATLSQHEALELIFHPGLSTIEVPTSVSGRGMGMNIVRTNIERLNGSVLVETWPGRGTRFQITLPLTLAIISAMLVRADDTMFAIPMHSVMETLRLSRLQVSTIAGREVIQLRGHVLPLVRLSQALGLPLRRTELPEFVLAVHLGKLDVGLLVDDLIGDQEVVIKSLGSLLGGVTGVAGGSILGDGTIALVVDIPSLFNLVGVSGGR